MNPFYLFRFVPLSVLKMIARFVAWLIMKKSTLNIHNTVHKNLLIARPSLDDHQRHNLHKQVVYNQCLTAVESIKSWAMPVDWSMKQIKQIHDQSLLIDALNNPNGMLAIVPHLGTWEIMNAWLNQHGSPTIMYKPIKGKLSNEFVLQGRERLGSHLVPTDATGVKSIFKTLKSGGFSIILPDHVPQDNGGVIAPFFDIPTMSSTLASKLASKTKCALVGLVCLRRTDNQGFDIYCYQLTDEDLYNRDNTIATTALNHAVQNMIEPICEHYMWSYKRFRHVPNMTIYQSSDEELISFVQKK